jgi:hypothetical protein
MPRAAIAALSRFGPPISAAMRQPGVYAWKLRKNLFFPLLPAKILSK